MDRSPPIRSDNKRSLCRHRLRYLMIAFFGLVLGVASGAVLVYGAVTISNMFNSGDPVSLAEMNANFQTIEDAFNCPGDMVEVGSFCIDKYEASVWDGPTGPGTDTQLGGGVGCQPNGNDCSKAGPSPSPIYALSVINVRPAGVYTWFQAQQACANVGKRLPTNAEWQMAAAGTPETPDCNIASPLPPGERHRDTGNAGTCVSKWGAEDMVGNVSEWVADWLQGAVPSNATLNTSPAFGSDGIRNIGPAPDQGTGAAFPAALLRGGEFTDQDNAGVFSLAADFAPSGSFPRFGFRCAR